MEVGWHLRFSREDALEIQVQPRLAPNVEDAVFIVGDWVLEWDRAGEPQGYWSALVRRRTAGE